MRQLGAGVESGEIHDSNCCFLPSAIPCCFPAHICMSLCCLGGRDVWWQWGSASWFRAPGALLWSARSVDLLSGLFRRWKDSVQDMRRALYSARLMECTVQVFAVIAVVTTNLPPGHYTFLLLIHPHWDYLCQSLASYLCFLPFLINSRLSKV